MNKSAWATCLCIAAGVASGQAAETGKSLYDRLGGAPAMHAVANGLVDQILIDNRVNKWFTHAASSPENTASYKAHLSDFICKSTGGPCQYAGPDMMTVHAGRGVTNEAFAAVVEDLTVVLDHLQVPEKEKHEVLGLIGSLKPAIVQTSTIKK